MDTHLRHDAPTDAPTALEQAPAEEAAKVSAIIGSEAFVERVLRAMTEGARQAVDQHAALEGRRAKP